jgi:hypothetical protein
MQLTSLIIVKFVRHVKVLAFIHGLSPGGPYALERSISGRMNLI